MFKNRNIKPNYGNCDFDKSRSVAYTPSIVAPLRWISLPNGVRKFQSDVTLLFNQERIASALGVDSLKAWLGSLDAAYRSKVDTSKLPDDVVLDFVKSRYIQSPSELLAWSQYLNDNSNALVSKYQKKLADQIADAAEQAAQQAQQAAQQAQQATQQSEG